MERTGGRYCISEECSNPGHLGGGFPASAGPRGEYVMPPGVCVRPAGAGEDWAPRGNRAAERE